VDGKLTRLSNFSRPFEADPPQPEPPVKIAVIAGLGLGSRKSDFIAKLGEPNFGSLHDQWHFTGKDGRSITIQPIFTNEPKTTTPTCTRITVGLAGPATEQRGEQYEGKS
jgi:hypothetical protein